MRQTAGKLATLDDRTGEFHPKTCTKTSPMPAPPRPALPDPASQQTSARTMLRPNPTRDPPSGFVRLFAAVRY